MEIKYNQWHCPVTCKVFTNHSRSYVLLPLVMCFRRTFKELCFYVERPEDLDATPFRKDGRIVCTTRRQRFVARRPGQLLAPARERKVTPN